MHPGEHAKHSPDKPAVVMADGGAVLTYRQLDERSNQGAQLFRSLGLRPGDRIALCLENHPRFLELCWAAQRSGLIYTAISSRLTPDEVEYILDDCGAQVFISSAAKRDLALALADRGRAVAHRFLLDAEPRGGQPVSLADAGPGLEEELLQWSRSQLAALKCPRSVDFEAELPRHPTGKLYKRLLRDRYWKGHESRTLGTPAGVWAE